MTSKTAHKMFKVFCTVHFSMFLYVYDLFHIPLSCDKIMDPWNVCMYERCPLASEISYDNGFH
jgi:hypothetical protein